MDSSLEIREGIQIFDKFIINVFSTILMFREVLMNESLRYVSVFVQMFFTVWATYLPRISGLSSFHLDPLTHHLALTGQRYERLEIVSDGQRIKCHFEIRELETR